MLISARLSSPTREPGQSVPWRRLSFLKILFEGQHNCIVCRNLHGIWLDPGRSPNADYHNKRLKRTHGISLSVFWEIYEQQGGRCAICKTEHPKDKSKKSLPLVVDHDHKTGKIRGLLCNNCNLGLGLFKDKLDRFNNALQYVNRSRK